MARTKQKSPERTPPTYEDMVTEARAASDTLARRNRQEGRIGPDGVRRTRDSDGFLTLERLPNRRAARYQTFTRDDGPVLVAVYVGDNTRVSATHMGPKGPSGLPAPRKAPRISPRKRKKEISPTIACRRSDKGGNKRQPKVPHRWRPGTKALMQIRKYQGHTKPDRRNYQGKVVAHAAGTKIYFFQKTATKLIIPKVVFQRTVREVFTAIKSDLRVTSEALEILQHQAESHLVHVFMDANLCAMHAGRSTLYKKDMHLARFIRRDPDSEVDSEANPCWQPKTETPRPDGVPQRYPGQPWWG